MSSGGPQSSLLNCTGAVLAGGRSSRMGTPKHLVRLVDGRAMVQHVIDAIRVVCGRIVVVGPRWPELDQDIRAIVDARPGLGPLAGIESLLASGLDESGQYLVCSCDVPRMTPDVLRMLLKPSKAPAAVIRLEGHQESEWLPARISADALPTVRSLIDSGERSVRALMRAVHAETVSLSNEFASAFANINTPDDLRSISTPSTRADCRSPRAASRGRDQI